MNNNNKSSKKLGQILLGAGIITEKQLTISLDSQKKKPKQLGEILIIKQFATEEQIVAALALQSGVPFIELDDYPIDPVIIKRLSPSFVQKHHIVPLNETKDGLLIVSYKIINADIKEMIKDFLGIKLRFALAVKKGVLELINTFYTPDLYSQGSGKLAIIENGSLKNFANEIIGESLAVKNVIKVLNIYAVSDETVLIEGETGTGKELVARAIHTSSNNSGKPFITVNCTALPDTLLESELFGYEKGAFTGAFSRKLGRFDLANGGTIFLDEIGDINPAMQAKLLRVLQEKKFERLGGTQTISVDVRVLTATNKDLRQYVKEGKYRDDLYYRLNVLSLRLPPLRERKEDIPVLVKYFIDKFSFEYKKDKKYISPKVLDLFYAYYWPGNIRELENIIRRSMVLAEGDAVLVEHLPFHIQSLTVQRGEDEVKIYPKPQSAESPVFDSPEIPENKTLKESVNSFEKSIILHCLEKNTYNRTKVAKELGLSRKGLRLKMRNLNIDDKD